MCSFVFFFFSSRRRHTRCSRDWSSDVCSSDLLHTQDPLMRELEKIVRVVGQRIAGAPHEVLLVLDATTGQNGVSQARQFLDAARVNGLVVTKLDGTAKGGVAVRIVQELGIPLRYIGVGEGPDDLLDFDPDEFLEGLLPSAA